MHPGYLSTSWCMLYPAAYVIGLSAIMRGCMDKVHAVSMYIDVCSHEQQWSFC